MASHQREKRKNLKYKALVLEKDIYISPESQRKIDQLKDKGVKILNSAKGIASYMTNLSDNDSCFVHIHRAEQGSDIYFLANISNEEIEGKFKLNDLNNNDRLELWITRSGKVKPIRASDNGTISIKFNSNESVFVRVIHR